MDLLLYGTRNRVFWRGGGRGTEEKGGSDGACALVWPGRPPASAEDLPFGVRTTTPSSHRGSGACAILTALPLCRWPDPRAERLGDKGAREGICFRTGPPTEGGDPDPFSPVLCNLLTVLSLTSKDHRNRGRGVSPCVVSAPPLPSGSSPHPRLPNLGLSEIPRRRQSCCLDDGPAHRPAFSARDSALWV